MNRGKDSFEAYHYLMYGTKIASLTTGQWVLSSRQDNESQRESSPGDFLIIKWINSTNHHLPLFQ